MIFELVVQLRNHQLTVFAHLGLHNAIVVMLFHQEALAFKIQTIFALDLKSSLKMRVLTYHIMELELMLVLHALRYYFVAFPTLHCISPASDLVETELRNLNKLFTIRASLFFYFLCGWNISS